MERSTKKKKGGSNQRPEINLLLSDLTGDHFLVVNSLGGFQSRGFPGTAKTNGGAFHRRSRSIGCADLICTRGRYLAAKSEADHYNRELKREEEEIITVPDTGECGYTVLFYRWLSDFDLMVWFWWIRGGRDRRDSIAVWSAAARLQPGGQFAPEESAGMARVHDEVRGLFYSWNWLSFFLFFHQGHQNFTVECGCGNFARKVHLIFLLATMGLTCREPLNSRNNLFTYINFTYLFLQKKDSWMILLWT